MPSSLLPRNQVREAVHRIIDLLETYDRPLHGVILDHLRPEMDLRLSEAIQEKDPAFYQEQRDAPLWEPADPDFV